MYKFAFDCFVLGFAAATFIAVYDQGRETGLIAFVFGVQCMVVGYQLWSLSKK